MSNYLAVATVTATLRYLLDKAASTAVGGAGGFVDRPDALHASPKGPGVNIFLYQVTPNADWRNVDLYAAAKLRTPGVVNATQPPRRPSEGTGPTRATEDGALRRRPQLALNLHYLLSFYGDENTYQPQRILGKVVTFLHSEPILSRSRVLAASTGDLVLSDLKDQPEVVRLVSTALSTEDLSKLWSVFFQVPYRLSVAYQASVVLLEPDVEVGQVLPVEKRAIAVTPEVAAAGGVS